MVVNLIGQPKSSYPMLKQSIANFKTSAVIPGLAQGLIIYAQMSFNMWQILADKVVPTKLTLKNPFKVPIKISGTFTN